MIKFTTTLISTNYFQIKFEKVAFMEKELQELEFILKQNPQTVSLVFKAGGVGNVNELWRVIATSKVEHLSFEEFAFFDGNITIDENTPKNISMREIKINASLDNPMDVDFNTYPKFLEDFAEVCLSGSPNLTAFSFTNGQVSGKPDICKVLDKTKPQKLTVLDLSYNDIETTQIDYLSNLPSPINQISLNGNKLLGIDIYHLLLTFNKTIQTLSLDSCKLRDMAISNLYHALLKCKKLRTLTISNNKITSAGAANLAELIKKHKRLEALDLSDNLLTDDGVIAIANAIKLAPGFLTLNVVGNKEITLTATRILMQVLDQTDLIHLEVPTLFDIDQSDGSMNFVDKTIGDRTNTNYDSLKDLLLKQISIEEITQAALNRVALDLITQQRFVLYKYQNLFNGYIVNLYDETENKALIKPALRNIRNLNETFAEIPLLVLAGKKKDPNLPAPIVNIPTELKYMILNYVLTPNPAPLVDNPVGGAVVEIGNDR